MRRAAIVLAICGLCPFVGRPAALTRQTPAPSSVEIPVLDGRVTGALVMPSAAAGKVPAVILVSGLSATAGEGQAGLQRLADAVAADGVACWRYERRKPLAAKTTDSGFESEVADAAAWVSFVRNDVRFSTITVAGLREGSLIGTIAGRVARADTSVPVAEADVVASAKAVIQAVRALDAPGVFHPRRNTGQRASLRDTTIAMVDGSRIGIEYGRPSKRGRAIWGVLVPWGRWWMPGADEATTLTTDDTLVFGELVVPKGEHTIYTLPGDSVFSLIINNETGQFHTVYNANRDLGRVPMTLEPMDPSAERLTYVVGPRRTGGGGVLKLIWDDRAYGAPFVVRRP